MNDVDAPSEKSLNLLFPLPYRVFGLFGLGILAWATNLHGLDKLGVDTVSALDLRTEGVHARGPLISHRSAGYNQVIAANLYTSAYRVFIGYTVIWFFFMDNLSACYIRGCYASRRVRLYTWRHCSMDPCSSDMSIQYLLET